MQEGPGGATATELVHATGGTPLAEAEISWMVTSATAAYAQESVAVLPTISTSVSGSPPLHLSRAFVIPASRFVKTAVSSALNGPSMKFASLSIVQLGGRGTHLPVQIGSQSTQVPSGALQVRWQVFSQVSITDPAGHANVSLVPPFIIPQGVQISPPTGTQLHKESYSSRCRQEANAPEQYCISVQGVPMTHPGIWTLALGMIRGVGVMAENVATADTICPPSMGSLRPVSLIRSRAANVTMIVKITEAPIRSRYSIEVWASPERFTMQKRTHYPYLRLLNHPEPVEE